MAIGQEFAHGDLRGIQRGRDEMNQRNLVLAIVLPLASLSTPQTAAFADDNQLRMTVGAKHGIVDGLSFGLAVQMRLSDDFSRLSQIRMESSLGLDLAPGITLGVNHDYMRNYPGGRGSYTSHRISEQLSYPLVSIGSARFDGRTRFEQMFSPTQDRAHYRLRQRLRVTAPIPGVGELRGVAYGEGYRLFRGQQGVSPKWEQVRLFAGVSMPLGDKTSLQAGYLHMMLLPRPNRTDRAIDVMVSTSF